MGILLALAEFESQFRVVHDSIFASVGTEGVFFRNPAWKVVLLPYGIRMSPDDFGAISKTAQHLGDNQLIVLDIESVSPPPKAAIVSWDYDDLRRERVRHGTNFSLLDTHLFGCSGRWGAVSSCSLDDILILGGDEQFMSLFIPSAGGMEALRLRFLEFATDFWRPSAGNSENVVELAGWN